MFRVGSALAGSLVAVSEGGVNDQAGRPGLISCKPARLPVLSLHSGDSVEKVCSWIVCIGHPVTPHIWPSNSGWDSTQGSQRLAELRGCSRSSIRW